jgi:hypothetical protein
MLGVSLPHPQMNILFALVILPRETKRKFLNKKLANNFVHGLVGCIAQKHITKEFQVSLTKNPQWH